jgi:hypothetical protein
MFLIQDSWIAIEPRPEPELDPEAPPEELEDPHAANTEGAAIPRAAHCSIERRLRRAAERSSFTKGLLYSGDARECNRVQATVGTWCFSPVSSGAA